MLFVSQEDLGAAVSLHCFQHLIGNAALEGFLSIFGFAAATRLGREVRGVGCSFGGLGVEGLAEIPDVQVGLAEMHLPLMRLLGNMPPVILKLHLADLAILALRR